MKMTVYVDLLILVNFLANYIFLKMTAVFSHTGTNTLRLVTASFTVSIFSLILIFDIPLPLALILKAVSLVLCSVISFGYQNIYIFVKRTVILIVICACFTGVLFLLAEKTSVIYINNCSFYLCLNPLIFISYVVLFYILFTVLEFIFCRQAAEYFYNITLFTEYGEFSSNAYYDTGFKVRDIVSYNPVLMCNLDLLEKEGVIAVRDICSFYNGTYSGKNIVPVFYSDVSGEGMMAGIRVKKRIICSNKCSAEVKNVILAVSKRNFSQEQLIIFGKDMYSKIGD